MGLRRKGRESALQILYQMDVGGASASEASREFWLHSAASREGEEFANELVVGVEREDARIEDAIKKASDNWRIERMARVDRNILRLCVYELLFMKDVPRRVTLNEGIELAKRFGHENSAAFVNGLLDRIASDIGKE